jgi:hypothetical protein
MITATNVDYTWYSYEDVTCSDSIPSGYISGSSGSAGTTGCPGCTGPTGAAPIKIPAPRRLLPSSMVMNLSRQMRWLSLLRENNSRRG